MKNFLFIASLNSSIDNQRNTLSIFDCLENIIITVKERPDPQKGMRLPIRFELISGWTLESSKKNILTIKHQLIDSSGKIVIESPERNIKINEGVKRVMHRERGSSIHITSDGKYHFKLLQKEEKKFKEVSRFPLEVVFQVQKR